MSSIPTTATEKACILGEALPYIQRFHDRNIVIKHGGKAVGLNGKDGGMIRAKKNAGQK